jgi:hypothetical protein
MDCSVAAVTTQAASKRSRIARHHAPEFSPGKKVRNVIARAVINKLNAHDITRNSSLNRLRTQGGIILGGKNKERIIPPRPNKIRVEREETLREVQKALVFRADFSDSDEFFLEVKASVAQLARDIGQLHHYEKDYNGTGQYRHGRYTYDPVKKALVDLEAAGLIVVQRKYNVSTKQYYANRIWLTPQLFIELGIHRKELASFIRSHRAYTKTTLDKRKATLHRERQRFTRDCRLQESVRPELKKHLARIVEFNDFVEGREAIKEVKKQIRKSKPAVSKESLELHEFYNTVKPFGPESNKLQALLSELYPDAKYPSLEYLRRYQELIQRYFPQLIKK